MRARGLKHQKEGKLLPEDDVAPHAGAWIETLVAIIHNHPSPGRAPCGRVD